MKINIYGNGAEIVIGKLSEKQTDKIFPLLSKKDDGICLLYTSPSPRDFG